MRETVWQPRPCMSEAEEDPVVSRLEERTQQLEKRLENLERHDEPEKKEGGDKPEKKEDAGKPQKKKKRIVFVIVAILVILAALAVGIPWYLHSLDFEKTDDAFIEGHIVRLDPKVAAYVTAVHGDDNGEVTKGDLLIELDPRDFQVALDRANSQVLQANAAVGASRAAVVQADAQVMQSQAKLETQRAAVTRASTQSELARVTFGRNEKLSQDNPRAVSREAIDNARAAQATAQGDLDAAKAELAAAGAMVKSSEAAVESAKAQVTVSEAEVVTARSGVTNAELQLGYTKIYAPVSGRITRKAVEPGDYVGVNQALLLLVPPEMWVTANFKETQLTHIRPGQPVEIRVDAFPDHNFRGKIDSVQRGSGARFSLLPPENATGNFVKVVQRVPVKIRFDQDARDLPMLGPGMSVEPKVDISNAR